MITMKVKKLNPLAIIPTKAHEEDAGWDIYTTDSFIIPPGERRSFNTGITMEIPYGWAGLYWPRSSLGFLKGLHVLGGVVDSGFRGEHRVCLVNLSNEPVAIQAGDRIAQMVLQRVYTGQMEEVEELSPSVRGENGWGSTGR